MAAAGERKTIKIDVISDFLCPWCYIGHKDLERGIAQARAANLPVDFVIQYHPYILNPSMTCSETKTKKEYFERKFGVDGALKMQAMLVARGKEEGITFTFDGFVRSTLRAHRLMTKAYLVGQSRTQLALLSALFHACFEVGEDIGDVALLAGHAARAGVFASAADADAWLRGSELEEEVQRMSAEAQRKGVTGVPFAVIEGKWAVSGCQKPECYFKIFEKLATSEPLSPLPKPTVGTAVAATS